MNLSPLETLTVKLLREGLSREELCEELLVTNSHLKKILYNCRKKGVDIPYGKPGRPRLPVQGIRRTYKLLKSKGFRAPINLIADRYNLTRKAVLYRLYRKSKADLIAPLTRRPSPWTAEKITELTNLFLSGLSARQIAKRFSVTHGTVSGKLHRLKLTRKKASQCKTPTHPKNPAFDPGQSPSKTPAHIMSIAISSQTKKNYRL